MDSEFNMEEKECLDCQHEFSARLFAKAIGIFLEHKQSKGIIIEMPEGQFTISIRDDQISVADNREKPHKCPDGSLITLHNTIEDAITKATLEGGEVLYDDFTE